jgi:hypothetical protein
MTTQEENVDFNKDIVIMPIKQWLDFSSGKVDSVFIALPLIQRGFVWKPNQIIDLWDTLLRGMPVGSLIFSPMQSGIEVRKIGKKELVPTPKSGAIGLIDGQQRTLSMLIPWLNVGDVDRRIWVDFADKPGDGHLFRLRVTTINQPFGFQKAAPSAKLSLGDKRLAMDHFIDESKNESPDREYLFKEAKPYLSKYPIDLKVLIDEWIRQNGDKAKWINTIEEKLNENKPHLKDEEYKLIQSNISNFKVALERLFNLKIPLLKVDKHVFEPDIEIEQVNTNEIIDPPLAVLFKRIGTGGTALSDADYAFSVIKHHLPESYTLVENLHSKENIAGLLTATDLVMTAIRLAAAEYSPSIDKQITDWESPSKRDFHSLIKKDKNAKNGFLDTGFLPLIKDGSLGLGAAFSSLTELLEYKSDTNPNGLPVHAFPVLSRPLVQVLLRWIRCIQLSSHNDMAAVLSNNREDILRFIMYWQLCVLDPKKASVIAFKHLKGNTVFPYFPAKEVYKALVDGNAAIQIIAPDTILELKNGVVYTPSGVSKLRGWQRFSIKPETIENERQVMQLYQRWWGNINRHIHPLLLWLQRETVSGFGVSPVAGREEDTPYDYDHICPSKHWADWTGESGNEGSLMKFVENINDGRGHVYIGNSIGNIRVWDSSKNRGDGDDAPSKKLKFDDEKECAELLRLSAIDPSQIEGWKVCSEGVRSWSGERALAFQRVVEQRAFDLYQKYYNDLGFSSWSDSMSDAAKKN